MLTAINLFALIPYDVKERQILFSLDDLFEVTQRDGKFCATKINNSWKILHLHRKHNCFFIRLFALHKIELKIYS